MARTWLSIRVDLVDGMHASELWPRPGRILLARPGMTFRMLADAVNDAFARWDRSHVHAFTLGDGTRIALRGPWDEPDDDELDDTKTTLSRLDDELAEEFERVLHGEAGDLRAIPVDLEELAFELEGPNDFDEGWMLEIATGQVWPRDPVGMAGIEEPEDFDDPDSFLALVRHGSGPGYGDMRDFIGTVTDDALAGRLDVATQGKGAFRRFKDTLYSNEPWWVPG